MPGCSYFPLSSSLLANSVVERCRTDDLMPNVPISCLPPSHVDSEVQGLKVVIDCPQPDSSGWPTGLLQSAGGLSAAAMTQWWSSLGVVRARCPKKCSFSTAECQMIIMYKINFKNVTLPTTQYGKWTYSIILVTTDGKLCQQHKQVISRVSPFINTITTTSIIGETQLKKLVPKGCTNAHDQNCAVWLVSCVWKFRWTEIGSLRSRWIT